MCGAETNNPTVIQTEGTKLRVCSNCTKFGTVLHDETEEESPGQEKAQTSSSASASTSTTTRSTTQSQSTQRRQRDIFDEIETLASDYDKRVRDARESKGLTQEELAKNLKEKVSVIKKIENGHMQPNEDLREKLERELQVSLTEEIGEEEWESETTSGGYTLGDIVKRKEK